MKNNYSVAKLAPLKHPSPIPTSAPKRSAILNALTPNLAESDFDSLALTLLRWQATHNPAYANFLRGLQLDPDDLDHWSRFPALPAACFRENRVACFPPDQVATYFLTSGTTSQNQGRHEFASLEFYQQALFKGFTTALPELSSHQWISLIPPPSCKPHSSLSFMIGYLDSVIPKTKTLWLADADYQLDLRTLEKSLRSAAAPLAIFGTSFALDELADLLSSTPLALPDTSIVFDTGGFKGRRRSLLPAELWQKISTSLGLPRHCIFNEYGMTELSSQAYARADEGIHRLPPWMRARLVDPVSGKPCQPGQSGLLHLYDLANVDSIMAVATQDLAVETSGGYRLLGRLPGAPQRGCSLPYE